MRQYTIQAYPMDKDIKATLIHIKSILNRPNDLIYTHTVGWDGHHFVILTRYPNTKWGVSIVTKNGEKKMSATLYSNQVIGWTYSAMNHIQYKKYNKHSKFKWIY